MEMKIKVIRKTAEGAYFTSVDGKSPVQFLDWENFKVYARPDVKKFIYIITIPDEELEGFENQKSRFEWLMPKMGQIMILMNPNVIPSIENMFLLGSISGEYREKFPNNSMLDFVADVRFLREQFINQLTHR